MKGHRIRAIVLAVLVGAGALSIIPGRAADKPEEFKGRWFSGRGDVEYLRLLDTARRLFEPDSEFQNMPMFYYPAWNGLVEGPTWDAWWIQNSYGPTYCALPFWQEPYVTFMQNSQDLWFDQMGDGKHVGGEPYKWVAPDGCLCDAARPGWIFYKQGDGRVDIHDWGMEFTAAGVVLQAEALLIARDAAATARYLPKLERCADFLETRRDPKNNLYLAGPAGNLLAPSYAGWKKPDGTYDKAYLAGLSITTIAALDRLIELEKMAGRADKIRLYSERRELSRRGLPLLTTDEGYFIKSLDPDGTKHGVFGAAKHGYFEAISNHDAVCFRVADNAQAAKIYAKIASIPGLRPYDLIITNYPSLDDLYTEPKDLWEFGRWVNGGHWSTCEARLIMAYYRLNKTDDARRSMERILGFARRFRMDNNLTSFGSEVYQPKEPINCVYDAWGIPAAFIRGLFEYLYRADGLTVVPHIPARITALNQNFPIRFGSKRLYLTTAGSGPVTGVRINDKAWPKFDAEKVTLPFADVPAEARIQIALGGAAFEPVGTYSRTEDAPPGESAFDVNTLAAGLSPTTPANEIAALTECAARMGRLLDKLAATGQAGSYEASHARLILRFFAVCRERLELQSAGRLTRLPEVSQAAADRAYFAAATKLCLGLEKVLESYSGSMNPVQKQIRHLWEDTRIKR